MHCGHGDFGAKSGLTQEETETGVGTAAVPANCGEEIKLYAKLSTLPIPRGRAGSRCCRCSGAHEPNPQQCVLWRKWVREELGKKDPALPRLAAIFSPRFPE